MSRNIVAITATEASLPAAHYSQAVQAGDLVWTAGIVGRDPVSQKVISTRFEDQVDQAIRNVRAILHAAGTDLEHVIKSTCFITKRANFRKMDPIYRSYFGAPPPARSTLVCDLVFEDLLFEIEVVARIPSEAGRPAPISRSAATSRSGKGPRSQNR